MNTDPLDPSTWETDLEIVFRVHNHAWNVAHLALASLERWYRILADVDFDTRNPDTWDVTWDGPDTDRTTTTLPIKWLFMTTPELTEAVAAEIERRKAVADEREQAEIERRKAVADDEKEWQAAEYIYLKAKFNGG